MPNRSAAAVSQRPAYAGAADRGAAMSQRPINSGSLLNPPGRAVQVPAGNYRRVEGIGGTSGVIARGSQGGAGAVAARGPYGYHSYARLPQGSVRYPWRGTSYWHYGSSWYQPYYYGGAVYYSDVPAPIGYVTDDLPDNYIATEQSGNTYYYSQNTYYVKKGGKYEVVANPADQGQAALAAIDPQAMEQIRRMGEFLATVRAASVTVVDVSDQILDSGQKVQVESTRKIAVRLPDRLAVEYQTLGQTRRIVYDGKTVTVFEKEQNLYAQEPMPPTLPETLDTLSSKYGIAVPTAELLRPGLYDRLKAQARSAEYMGVVSIDGVPCHHVAFSKDWADCQIWIQDGKEPLPRKVAVAYKKIPGTPKHSSNLSAWNLTDPGDSAFDIALPPDAQKIAMTPINASE